MIHPIYRVRSIENIVSSTLKIGFDDGMEQTVDFQPAFRGEMFGPLRDLSLFNQVKIDPEACTLVWPNGADFDPAMLHDWPEHKEGFEAAAMKWGSR